MQAESVREGPSDTNHLTCRLAELGPVLGSAVSGGPKPSPGSKDERRHIRLQAPASKSAVSVWDHTDPTQ